MNEKWLSNAVLSEIFSRVNVAENSVFIKQKIRMMISFCGSCQASDNITKLDSSLLIDLITDLQSFYQSDCHLYHCRCPSY